MTPSRPEGLADTYWDAKDGVKFAPLLEELNRLTAAEAAESARRAAVPEKPEAYQLQVTSDFKLPDGQKWTPDANHPLVSPMRALAHKKGWTQEDFSEVLSAWAGYEVAQRAAEKAEATAEAAKLGSASATRITEVGRWLSAMNGGKPSRVFSELATAEALEEIESLIRKMSAQGSGNYRNGGREPPEPPPKTLAQRMYPNLPSRSG